MKHSDKVLNAYNEKRINEYMRDRMLKAVDFGVEEQLVDDAIDDAEHASNLGVRSDKDYAVRFYILNLGKDLLHDTFEYTIHDGDLDSLAQYAINNSEDKHLKDLVGMRILCLKWLKEKHNKKAYPNVGGWQERQPVYDRNKWIEAAKNMYAVIKANNISRDNALHLITKDWDMDEQFKFDNWLKYYEGGNANKYDIKVASMSKEATLPFDMVESTIPRSNTPPSLMSAYKIKEDEAARKREKEDALIRTKRQMKSRLKSLWNLAHKYNDLLPKTSMDNILALIHHLDVGISKLQTEASIRDSMFRSALRIKKMGFGEGAELLVKMAEEPVNKAIIDSAQEDKMLNVNKPNIQVSTIIDRLEILSKMLKSRDIVRSLAGVDILLNELGMASLFPELGDAQSKLNDAFGYASNKIDDIISKLRGAGDVKRLNVSKKPPSASKPPEPPIPTQIQQPPRATQSEEKMSTEELKETTPSNIKTELPEG